MKTKLLVFQFYVKTLRLKNMEQPPKKKLNPVTMTINQSLVEFERKIQEIKNFQKDEYQIKNLWEAPLDSKTIEINQLKSELNNKDEDIMALKLLNAELTIENNRKDETIATLKDIIEKFFGC